MWVGWWGCGGGGARDRDENLHVDSCLLYSFSRTKMPFIIQFVNI